MLPHKWGPPSSSRFIARFGFNHSLGLSPARTDHRAPDYQYYALHFVSAFPSLQMQVEGILLSSRAPARALPALIAALGKGE